MENLDDFDDILDTTPKTQYMKSIVATSNLDFIKLKMFCSATDNVMRTHKPQT